MRVKAETVFRMNKGIFILSVSLFIGNLAQGAPLEKARYKWVRCSPDAASANCIEEQGQEFAITQSEAKGFLPPSGGPVMVKTILEKANIVLFSGEGSGSGVDVASGSEPDVGSGMDYSPHHLDIRSESAQEHPDHHFKLNLRDEDFIL
ncbi:serglycin [Ambystoma mexicanum]|uniref:serglycin n=1 Tax=Ambystoma mexicanum TaxID=8296 RepID=UPI0037E80FB9